MMPSEIKSEPVFFSEEPRPADFESQCGDAGPKDVYYSQNRNSGNRFRGNSFKFGGFGRGRERSFPGQSSARRGNGGHKVALNRKLNAPGRDGEPSKCVVCESKYHWARNCPHSFEKNESCSSNKSEDSVCLEKGESVQFSLLTTYADGVELDEGEKLKKLPSETYGKVVLDTGCSTTVCGEIWLKSFIDYLSAADKLKISISTLPSYIYSTILFARQSYL